MRSLTTSAVLCAILAAGPVTAQVTDESDVFRNDLPETHDGLNLPQIGAAGDLGAEAQTLQVIASGSVAAQQYGNVAAAKQASGVVRDLGDAMVLLHSGINQRLDRLGEQLPPRIMPEGARDQLEELDDLNEQAFNLGFATSVTDSYPAIIDAWQQIGDGGPLSDLAQAVVPRLQEQLAVAEAVVEADGNLMQIDPDLPTTVAAGGVSTAPAGETAPIGEEGQLGERQHTPEPEVPTVQTGENYEHEQVEVDPQAQTESLPDDPGQPEVPPAAGELEIANAGGLFSAIRNPEVERAQLAQASDLTPDQVRVVAIGDLLTEAEMEAVERALEDRQQDVGSLREIVQSDQALSGALERAGAAAQDVIAFDVLDEGAVIYTHAAGSQGN